MRNRPKIYKLICLDALWAFLSTDMHFYVSTLAAWLSSKQWLPVDALFSNNSPISNKSPTSASLHQPSFKPTATPWPFSTVGQGWERGCGSEDILVYVLTLRPLFLPWPTATPPRHATLPCRLPPTPSHATTSSHAALPPLPPPTHHRCHPLHVTTQVRA